MVLRLGLLMEAFGAHSSFEISLGDRVTDLAAFDAVDFVVRYFSHVELQICYNLITPFGRLMS